jgi:tRNA-Thr(GGU) m(6)t(6)A37 methyltransferase TsaA
MNEPGTRHDDWKQVLAIRPVGVVHSDLKEPGLSAGRKGLTLKDCLEAQRARMQQIKALISHITLDPDLEGVLEGLEDFSHALVLYWPHLAAPESRNLRRVHPMGRKDIEKVGVFATCSPGRPNPILVTAVKILNVTVNTLTVQGLEAVDGSPVLDIKPYSRRYLLVEDPKNSAWMDRIERELGD